MKKAQKITAALAISMGLTMGATPAADAIVRAPLAQSDDQMSRSVVFIDKGTCTGTLIDKDWVLTAKHCLKGPGDSSGVTIGSTLDIGPDMKNFERRTVSQIKTPYPMGGSTGRSADLALLKLNKSSSVLPAKVYDNRFSKVKDGARTRSYGWNTSLLRRDSDGELYKPFSKKVPFQTGKIVNANNVPEEDQMVGNYFPYPLAHVKLDGTSRTVPGDSGGPLFLADGRLYGVLYGSSKDLNKNDRDPYAKFNQSSYSGYTVIQNEIDWMKEVTGVDFTDPARNIELQKKSDANPQKFRTPTRSDYGGSEEEETVALKILYYSIMSETHPDYPEPSIPKPDSIGRTPRDPRPYDSNIQAGDDKVPTTTSTPKKRPDWITNPDYPTSKPSTSKKPKPQPEPSTTKNLLPDEPSTTKEKPTTTSKAEPKPSTTKPTTTSKAEPKPKPSTTSTTSKVTPKPSTTSTTSKSEPKPKPKPSTTSTTSTSKSEPKPKPSATSTTSKAEPKPSTPKDKPTTTKEEPKPSTPKDKPTTTSKEEPKPSTPKDKPTTTSKEEPKPSTPKEEPTTSKEEPKPVESSSPSESTEAPSLSETTDSSEKPSSSSPSVSSPSPDEPSELTTSADSNSTAPDSDGDGTSTADSTSKNPSTSAKSTTSEDDEPVEETTKPTTSKPDDNDGDDSSNTPSSSSSSQVGDFTDPKGVAIKGTTLNEDQLLKAINAGTKNRPGSNPQKILDELLSPLPASSQVNAAIAGPVVDTGGSVEKEGFFERIRNFLFG